MSRFISINEILHKGQYSKKNVEEHKIGEAPMDVAPAAEEANLTEVPTASINEVVTDAAPIVEEAAPILDVTAKEANVVEEVNEEPVVEVTAPVEETTDEMAAPVKEASKPAPKKKATKSTAKAKKTVE